MLLQKGLPPADDPVLQPGHVLLRQPGGKVQPPVLYLVRRAAQPGGKIQEPVRDLVPPSPQQGGEALQQLVVQAVRPGGEPRAEAQDPVPDGVGPLRQHRPEAQGLVPQPVPPGGQLRAEVQDLLPEPPGQRLLEEGQPRAEAAQPLLPFGDLVPGPGDPGRDRQGPARQQLCQHAQAGHPSAAGGRKAPVQRLQDIVPSDIQRLQGGQQHGPQSGGPGAQGPAELLPVHRPEPGGYVLADVGPGVCPVQGVEQPVQKPGLPVEPVCQHGAQVHRALPQGGHAAVHRLGQGQAQFFPVQTRQHQMGGFQPQPQAVPQKVAEPSRHGLFPRLPEGDPLQQAVHPLREGGQPSLDLPGEGRVRQGVVQPVHQLPQLLPQGEAGVTVSPLQDQGAQKLPEGVGGDQLPRRLRPQAGKAAPAPGAGPAARGGLGLPVQAVDLVEGHQAPAQLLRRGGYPGRGPARTGTHPAQGLRGGVPGGCGLFPQQGPQEGTEGHHATGHGRGQAVQYPQGRGHSHGEGAARRAAQLVQAPAQAGKTAVELLRHTAQGDEPLLRPGGQGPGHAVKQPGEPPLQSGGLPLQGLAVQVQGQLAPADLPVFHRLTPFIRASRHG